MAANEPKITRLKRGEGAGDFKRKQGPGTLQNKPGQKNQESMRSRTPKGQRRTQNPAILSDGSVDPRSSQYQRSVAGREKLEDYVKRLDSQGVDERDIFMAAVQSLKNRGHGYVGAYLDSKNPNRRYNDVQAKAIADAVMTKAEVGNNPGARLTKGESDESKEARGDKRAAAKESGAAPEPGRKAMSVGQQRKQPGGRGKDALGMPETWAKADKGVELNTPEAIEKEKTGWKDFDPAKSDLQRPEKAAPSRKEIMRKKEEDARRSGTSATPTAAQKFQKSLKEEPKPTIDQGAQLEELLDKREEMDPEEWSKAFAQLIEAVKTGEGGQREELREYISKIKGSGKKIPLPGSEAAAARDKEIAKNQAKEQEEKELRQKQAQAGREEAKKRRQAQKEAEEERRIEEEIPVDEESGDLGNIVDPIEIGDKFRELFRDNIKAGLSTDPQSLVEETVEILNDDYGASLSVDDAMRIVSNRFGARGIDGRRIKFPAQEAQGPKTTTEQPQEEPEATTEGTPPKRQPLPEEQLGQGRKRQVGGAAKGFTPQAQSEIKNSIRKAKSQGMTAEQVIEAYKQGTLFPSGLVTETSQTNPLEGGSTPQTPPEKPSVPEAESGSLLDEQGRAKDFRGKPRKESTRQIPLRLPGVSSERLKGQADIEKRRIARETKALGKPPTSPRKRGKAPTQPGLFTPSGRPRRFNTAEMSYEEFSQTVRSLIR